MASRSAWIVAVIVVVIVIVAGVFVYLYVPHAGQNQGSSNWAGYVDRTTVSSASGTIQIPAFGAFSTNGTQSYWVGMGGDDSFLHPGWPFWQAGATVVWTNLTFDGLGVYYSVYVWTEGGSGQSGLCSGSVCPIYYQHLVTQTEHTTSFPALTVGVELRGTAQGANATLTLIKGGITTVLYTPEWVPLAGSLTFPSAEWIYEAPSEYGQTVKLSNVAAPGAVFSNCTDSAGLSVLGTMTMTGNPWGQTITYTTFRNGGFSAYVG